MGGKRSQIFYSKEMTLSAPMSQKLLDRVHFLLLFFVDNHHGCPVRRRGNHGGRLTDVNRDVRREPRE